MTSDDITVRVLVEIRDAVRATNERVDKLDGRVEQMNIDLGKRIDETNHRIDETNQRLSGLEIPTATSLNEVTGTLREVTALLRDRLDLRDRVDRCERDIADLKTRVG